MGGDARPPAAAAVAAQQLQQQQQQQQQQQRQDGSGRRVDSLASATAAAAAARPLPRRKPSVESALAAAYSYQRASDPSATPSIASSGSSSSAVAAAAAGRGEALHAGPYRPAAPRVLSQGSVAMPPNGQPGTPAVTRRDPPSGARTPSSRAASLPPKIASVPGARANASLGAELPVAGSGLRVASQPLAAGSTPPQPRGAAARAVSSSTRPTISSSLKQVNSAAESPTLAPRSRDVGLRLPVDARPDDVSTPRVSRVNAGLRVPRHSAVKEASGLGARTISPTELRKYRSVSSPYGSESPKRPVNLGVATPVGTRVPISSPARSPVADSRRLQKMDVPPPVPPLPSLAMPKSSTYSGGLNNVKDIERDLPRVDLGKHNSVFYDKNNDCEMLTLPPLNMKPLISPTKARMNQLELMNSSRARGHEPKNSIDEELAGLRTNTSALQPGFQAKESHSSPERVAPPVSGDSSPPPRLPELHRKNSSRISFFGRLSAGLPRSSSRSKKNNHAGMGSADDAPSLPSPSKPQDTAKLDDRLDAVYNASVEQTNRQERSVGPRPSQTPERQSNNGRDAQASLQSSPLSPAQQAAVHSLGKYGNIVSRKPMATHSMSNEGIPRTLRPRVLTEHSASSIPQMDKKVPDVRSVSTPREKIDMRPTAMPRAVAKQVKNIPAPELDAANTEMHKITAKHENLEQEAKTLDALLARAKPRIPVPLEQVGVLAGTTLNKRELAEVKDYPEIYFTGRPGILKVGSKIASQANGLVYDDDRGDYLICLGDHLAYRYEVVDVLGKGSFGQVVRCIDHKLGTLVAIKIIRNKQRFHAQALVETKILRRLAEWDPNEEFSVVHIIDSFYFREHLCVVTELLGINLYELIKSNNYRGLPLNVIRVMTRQIIDSLILLRQKSIIHCDLKPENILLEHPRKALVRLIDFGSSCHEKEKVYTYIQSRFYRSPEVILGMSYGVPIDMWSLGCIIAELYTGYPLFPGENEQEQLACISEVIGSPEREIIEKSTRSKLFFDTLGRQKTFLSSRGKRRVPGAKSLQSVLKSKDPAFVDFVASCLKWNPKNRLTPLEALNHEFITNRRPLPKKPSETNGTRRLFGWGGSDNSSSNNGSAGGSSRSVSLGGTRPLPNTPRTIDRYGTTKKPRWNGEDSLFLGPDFGSPTRRHASAAYLRS